MTRRNSHTYQAAAAHARVMAARQQLANEHRQVQAEEPMHRYSHPIPQVCPETTVATDSSTLAAMTQVLEQLSCQNQLLVDLLGAVNSLTAALLARKDKI